MANSVQIKYKGEVLCCLDQTEIKMVEPFLYRKIQPQNLWKRICGWIIQFMTGRRNDTTDADFENWTKVSFRDGSWTKVKMPFWEFINEYC